MNCHNSGGNREEKIADSDFPEIKDEAKEEKPIKKYLAFGKYPLDSKESWRTLAIGVLIIAVFLQLFEVKITPKFSLPKRTAAAPKGSASANSKNLAAASVSAFDEKKVLPAFVTVPVRWNDLGAKMIKAGIINEEKFVSLYNTRGGLGAEEKRILSSSDNGEIRMTEQNAGFWLNMLWAFGLGNASPVLEKGPMSDPRYGGADRFASTGGWPFAQGDAMGHYGKHKLVNLTADQQALVEKVSKNIYRPCCGNSTYFPDCNHGMAMLGLLELMAASGVSETDMYKIALQVNSYWFPDTYLTLAQYFEGQGADWKKLDPKLLLSSQYSSAAGFKQIQAETAPVKSSSGGGGGCGA